jgi:hypothetical protein
MLLWEGDELVELPHIVWKGIQGVTDGVYVDGAMG